MRESGTANVTGPDYAEAETSNTSFRVITTPSLIS